MCKSINSITEVIIKMIYDGITDVNRLHDSFLEQYGDQFYFTYNFSFDDLITSEKTYGYIVQDGLNVELTDKAKRVYAL